jgi:prevent-host-death family protein
VPEISATDAARNFADLLDGVEHRHERYTIVRRGRAIGQISPVTGGRGADLKELVRGTRRDRSWAGELDDLRSLAAGDDRS